MNVTRAIGVLALLAVLISVCNTQRVNKNRWKKWNTLKKKQQLERQKLKRQQRKENKLTNIPDPADMANLLGKRIITN